MRDESDHRPIARAGLTDAEEAAISMLRRVARGQSSDGNGATGGNEQGSARRSLDSAATIFRDLWGGEETLRRRPLQLGCSENCILTKDERRLLRAIAAAQAEDMLLLDNYLYKIALDREGRRRLAEAVMITAAALAAQGHWLARPPGVLPIPAPALKVASIHGHALDAAHVAWPKGAVPARSPAFF